MIAYIKGIPTTLDKVMDMLSEEPYLASYAEVVGIGGLPLIITLLRRDALQMYGLRRKGIVSSISLSASLIIAIFTLRILCGDLSIDSFHLQFPYNIWYATLGAFAYGSLEAFFIIWLIVNTDLAFKSSRRAFSPGLLITVLTFGLSHVILSPQAGVMNAVCVTVE